MNGGSMSKLGVLGVDQSALSYELKNSFSLLMFTPKTTSERSIISGSASESKPMSYSQRLDVTRL
jgi:hypothetical protein